MRDPEPSVVPPVPIIPNNPEAENGLLSSLLQNPELFGQLPSEFGPSYFWCPAGKLIFTEAQSAWRSRRPLDYRSLEVSLKSDGKLELVGGSLALDALFSFVPSAANWSYYLQLVLLSYRRRETYFAATKLAYQAQNGDCPTMEALDGCLSHFGAKTCFGSGSRTAKSWATQVSEWLDYASMAAERRKANLVRFGIPELDNLIQPVEPQDLVVISGTPSSGKTALAGQLVNQVASAGGRVAWFSLEMSQPQIIGRQVALRASVPLGNLRSGLLTRAQLEAVTTQIKPTSELPITLVDRNCSITDIVGEIRRLGSGSQKPISLVVVDYVQLIKTDGLGEKLNREQQISHLSGALKGIAKELPTIVVALSQVNKEGTTRDSAAVEQDADVILQVKEVWDKNKDLVADQRRIWIKKQRNGPRGVNVRCRFQGEFLKFEPFIKPDQNGYHSPHNSD